MVTLKQIRHVVMSNLEKPFGVEQLAEALGISESHLRDICYQKYQMSPGFIIEGVHLEIALKLLVGNQLKIYEICRKAGYRNLKTFRNAFKRRLNMTPKEFRRNIAEYDDKELIELLWDHRGDIFR